MRNRTVDKTFLLIAAILVLGGFFLFISASLGLYARDGALFGAIAFNQAFFGLFLGALALVAFSKIHYRFWKKYAFHIFVLSAAATALVFIPGLGIEHGGATRWLAIASFSFQPAELLKLGTVIYLAAWFSSPEHNIAVFRRGLLPLLSIVAVVGAILLAQPDSGTFLVIFTTALAMFVIAGGKWKHMLIVFVIAVLGFGALVASKPYIMERVLTFANPARDSLGAGWQIKQSLIAAGSGGIFGKGFGQSVQKFNFLPEPIGDSIFAVAAEEFGFLGAVTIISFFVIFLLRGLYIARRSPDTFSGLLVSGIVIMIVFQSFINIASMVGVFPLTGLPLLFISHGSSALLIALAGVGIVLSVSRYKQNI